LSRKAVQRGLSRLADEGKQPPAPTEEPARTTVASSVLPRPLALRLGMDIDEIPWKTLAPGIEQFKIKMPRRGGDLRLLRVQPGLKLLRHGHYGSELTLVLKGAYGDETGEYRTGEVADLDEDIEHRPKAGPGEECICIIAGERHPRYKSLAIRLLRPFLGF
jgi:putative transcriptional regulator